MNFAANHYVEHVVSSFICFHWDMFFLQVVVPTIVSSVQFPCVIHVNCMMYAICTSLIYLCFVFCFPFVLCILFDKLFMYFMSIYWCTWTWQMIMQELFIDIHIFHHVLTFIWIFSFLMRIVLCIIYFYISYTVTLHLSYLWHIYFQQ